MDCRISNCTRMVTSTLALLLAVVTTLVSGCAVKTQYTPQQAGRTYLTVQMVGLNEQLCVTRDGVTMDSVAGFTQQFEGATEASRMASVAQEELRANIKLRNTRAALIVAGYFFPPTLIAAIVVDSVAASKRAHGAASLVDAINMHTDLWEQFGPLAAPAVEEGEDR